MTPHRYQAWATSTGAALSDSRRLATAKAQLAIRGLALHLVDASYLIVRREQYRRFTTLDGVEQFQVGLGMGHG